MKIILFAVVILTILSINNEAFSEEDRFGTSGRARTYVRHEERLADDFNQVRVMARMDGWFKVNDCVQVKGRLTTGKSYNSEAEATGLGDGEGELHLNLRHIYVDMSCMENMTVQIGAMPTQTKGYLGLTDYGWVDGARVIIKNPEAKREWVLTVGQVDDLGKPNVFERNFNDLNYAQVEMIQALENKSQIVVNVSKYEDSIFSRANIKWALQQYAQWLKAVDANIEVEALFFDTSRIGTRAQFNFKVKGWNILVAETQIDPDPSQAVRFGFLVKSFYGYGKNRYLEFDRQIAPSGKWIFFGRIRDGDAGKLVETGMTRRW